MEKQSLMLTFWKVKVRGKQALFFKKYACFINSNFYPRCCLPSSVNSQHCERSMPPPVSRRSFILTSRPDFFIDAIYPK
jgi:hypothetical protein